MASPEQDFLSLPNEEKSAPDFLLKNVHFCGIPLPDNYTSVLCIFYGQRSVWGEITGKFRHDIA